MRVIINDHIKIAYYVWDLWMFSPAGGIILHDFGTLARDLIKIY